MKNLGFILIAAGFLAGAFATSLDVQNVSWTIFGIGALAAIAGLFIFKRQASAHARSASVLQSNRSELTDSIQNIVKDLEAMTNGAMVHGAALREKIDMQLREDLRRFADARESMVHLFGLQAYADIMSHFAAGERYINRVWSASADGYDSEAETYLKKAAGQFDEARNQLSQAAAGIA
jgi:dTDP-glucose pyrophosphorylase